MLDYLDAPPEFPANIAWVLSCGLERMSPVNLVVRRPLRLTDPHQTAGVVTMDWNSEGYEIGGAEPTISTYTFRLQYLVKMMGDEQGAMLLHAKGSKTIRAMLYRDSELAVQLRSLTETQGGRTERLKKYDVRAQRFVSNELQGQFIYLSSLDVVVEVETI